MKRRITQKVKQVPTCAADSFDMLMKLYVGKQSVVAAMPTEVNRRARTSAAMIGLAISMGATGLLLPRQGDEAMAVEPMAAEPNASAIPTAPSTNAASVPAVEPTVVAVATPSNPVKSDAAVELKPTIPTVVEHKVQQGETLWELSKTYDIKPEAIAVSNNIKSSAVLPIGQKLRIPTVNGIVHDVQAGETVETISSSYGVEPRQLQASVPVSVSGQVQAGESVVVPGSVNDLLKARQDVALNNLKEQRNRLNDSLAELRSEESTNLSEQATVPSPAVTAMQSPTPVTLPSAVLKTKETVANAPQSVVSVPTSPVVIPVPTPEIAATPFTEPKVAKPSLPSIAIPVPTPEIAATPPVEPQVAITPNLPTGSATPQENPAKPKVPQPVVMQPLAAVPGTVYKVKPGDTLDAIARRHGVSRSELLRANPINNPNRLNVNQQLRIPQAQSARVPNQTVTLLPGINKPNNSVSGQEQSGVAAPTLAVPMMANTLTPVVPLQESPKPQAAPLPVLAQSTGRDEASPKSTVVDNSQSTQSAGSQSNLYIERLRADVLRLREEMGQQTDSRQASESVNLTVPTLATSSTSQLDSASVSTRSNPEFKANQTSSLELRRQRQQQLQQGPIQIEVPPPATTSASTPSRDLVATAPAPADNYNPSLRTPVGQPVSPELPSLSVPDMNFPENQQANGFIWPTKGTVTSGYGRRWGRMHKGIDIAAPIGTPVVAAAPGVVVSAGWNSGGYGNLVEIQHPDGSLTLYAHNNRILVRRGQEVAQGQQISEMGSTGYSTGPHCHFEVHPAGRGAVNPIAYLPRR